MLIVSQDRTKITQNIEIWITELYENIKCEKNLFYIKNSSGTLGQYTTVKRAKEILQEIFIAYGNMEMLKIPRIQINEFIPSEKLIQNIVYQMPEE
jgi:hypothetical protein